MIKVKQLEWYRLEDGTYESWNGKYRIIEESERHFYVYEFINNEDWDRYSSEYYHTRFEAEYFANMANEKYILEQLEIIF